MPPKRSKAARKENAARGARRACFATTCGARRGARRARCVGGSRRRRRAGPFSRAVVSLSSLSPGDARGAWVVLAAADEQGRSLVLSCLCLRSRRLSSSCLAPSLASVAAPYGASERRSCVATGDARGARRATRRARCVGGSHRRRRAGRRAVLAPCRVLPVLSSCPPAVIALVSRRLFGRRSTTQRTFRFSFCEARALVRPARSGRLGGWAVTRVAGAAARL